MTDTVRPTGGTNSVPLFARARYPNTAEAQDELTFRKDEILEVLQKDFNGQVDWWLCRRGNNIGMVPANYLEIFHPHSPKPAAANNTSTTVSPVSKDITVSPVSKDITVSPVSKDTVSKDDTEKDYDVPKSRGVKATIVSAPPRPRPPTEKPPLESDPRYADYDFPRRSPPSGYHSNNDIYDLPPTDDNEPDYDLPPVEVTPSDPRLDLRPNSISPSTSNRVSSISSSSINNSTIYDIPPTSPSAIYDVPPNDILTSGGGRSSSDILTSGGRSSGECMDISNMYENEAEEFLQKNKSDIDKKFEELWQCVYGNNAYWGSEMKNRRKETLLRTVTAAKDFDDTLLSLVAFGKGVHLALEHSNTKDVNFKKKYTAANTILVNKRKEVLSKIDILLQTESDVPITATVKALLEGARIIPQSVQAFVILIQANKSILFKTNTTLNDDLPVLTKTEVKNRPLPELPETTPTTNNERKSKRIDSGADYADIFTDNDMTTPITPPTQQETGKRRNPHDTLPPLPFATLRKKDKPTTQTTPTQSSRVISMDGDDYDDIDVGEHVTMVAAPPPPLPPRAEHYLSVNKRNGIHLQRQSSGGSSDGSSSPLRSRSPDITTPYGNHSNTSNHSNSPLKHEDRELLGRYSQQMELLIPGLKDAIQSLLESIRNAETPKEFVVKSKLAVVAAYKLVYIADSLHQKLLHNDIKATVIALCNQLTGSIKCLVADTKTAALQYPSVGSVDKMKESLKVLFPVCLDLITVVKNPPNI